MCRACVGWLTCVSRTGRQLVHSSQVSLLGYVCSDGVLPALSCQCGRNRVNDGVAWHGFDRWHGWRVRSREQPTCVHIRRYCNIEERGVCTVEAGRSWVLWRDCATWSAGPQRPLVSGLVSAAAIRRSCPCWSRHFVLSIVQALLDVMREHKVLAEDLRAAASTALSDAEAEYGQPITVDMAAMSMMGDPSRMFGECGVVVARRLRKQCDSTQVVLLLPWRRSVRYAGSWCRMWLALSLASISCLVSSGLADVPARGVSLLM